jgi:FtsH-binding integral membrane protein
MTLILTAIVIVFALWDSYVIRKNDNLKGWKKALHIALLGLALGITIAIAQKFNVRNMLICIPFTLAMTWIVKDITMGLALKHDPKLSFIDKVFYLGNGTWDKIWKRFPGGLLLFLKLILLGFGIHFIYYKLW